MTCSASYQIPLGMAKGSQEALVGSPNGMAQHFAQKTFIDLFAGAGCLSLGLMASGWKGVFAVEKNATAFDTLKHNLIDGSPGFGYQWPEWLPAKPYTVGRLAGRFRQELHNLRGQVTLIVGGPPCQGFSLAGKRKKNDVRNSQFKSYMRIVEAVQPLFILLENVQGITVEFEKKERAKKKKKVGRPPIPFSQRIARSLCDAGYEVQADLLRAADYGVPQSRPRYFLIAVKKGVCPALDGIDPFATLACLRQNFLRSKGLPADSPVTVKEALSDLETVHGTMPCTDSPKFMQGVYSPPVTHYQCLMQTGGNGTPPDSDPPDSHRIARHRPETVARFEEILATCRRGVQLNRGDRERLGMKKSCTVPLDPDQPSPTLTTLPDDVIHYSEPRILTVREYARVQSIPDWFQFRGMYTTGGERRVKECPRYTQAGNAVPPFLGEAIGGVFSLLHNHFLEVSFSGVKADSGRSKQQPVPVGAV